MSDKNKSDETWVEKMNREHLNIKTYLEGYGICCEYVIMWQGGFGHKGKKFGCDIIATVKMKDTPKRLSIAIPRWVLTMNTEILLPYYIIN